MLAGEVVISAKVNNQPRSSRRIFNPPQDDTLNNRGIPYHLLAQMRDDFNLIMTILKRSSLRAETRGQAIFELDN